MAAMLEARITDPVTVDRDVVNAIVKSGRAPTIQFSKPGYTPELLRAVNRLCAEFEDGLEFGSMDNTTGNLTLLY